MQLCGGIREGSPLVNVEMHFIVTLTTAMVCGLAGAQGTVDYPLKTVRVIVAAAPGGTLDIAGRLIAAKLGDNLKRQFVVDTRPGAGGLIGTELSAKSAPDGYTLLLVSATFTISPALHKDAPYDPLRDFVPISLATSAPYLLLVHPALPVKSVRELIAMAKARPGAMDAGVNNGSSTHLATAYFASAANIKLTYISYKGISQPATDTIAGQIQLLFGGVLANLPHIQSGRLRVLGVSTSARSLVLPAVPTIAESGLRDYDVSAWNGWVAPAGVSSTIIGKLNVELTRAIKSADVSKTLLEGGVEPVGSTPDHFQRLIAAEVPRWRKIVQDSSMRFE